MARIFTSARGLAVFCSTLAACLAAAGCSGDDTEGAGPPSGEDGGRDAKSGGDGSSLDGASPLDGTVDGEADGSEGGGTAADSSSPADSSLSDVAPDSSLSDAAPDSSVAPDASGDAMAVDAGVPLGCAVWTYASPVVLEDLTGTDSAAPGVFSGQLYVGEPASGLVRVISQAGPTVRVYGFDKSSNAVTHVDAASNLSTYERAHHFASVGGAAVTEILIDEQPDFLTATLLPDSVSSTGPLPTAIGVGQAGYGFAAVPFDDGNVFLASAFQENFRPDEMNYELGVSLAEEPADSGDTVAQVALSSYDSDFEGLQLAHASGTVYIFGSNNPMVGGISVWPVPDTAVVVTPPLPGAFDTSADARLIDVAPGATPATTDFAYVSGGIGGAPLIVRAGQVVNTSLGTVTAGDLAVVRTYDDVSTAPLSAEGAEWSGDDIFLMSPGPAAPDGGAAPGVNALWFDALGSVRAEAVGPNAILAQEQGTITSIVASAASISAASARWDVAWTETRGAGQVLLYNELTCETKD